MRGPVQRTAVAATAVLLAVPNLAACGSSYAPATGEQLLADLQAADLVSCESRRDPFPDVITCVDPDGDVTVALTDDGPTQATRTPGDGPFLVGDTWLVLTYDGDHERVEAMREALGAGALWVRGDDGEMAPADA